MNYKTAIKTQDKAKWDKAVEEEHNQMIKMKMWEMVP